MQRSRLLFQSVKHGDEVATVDEDRDTAKEQYGPEDFRQQQGGFHDLSVPRGEVGQLLPWTLIPEPGFRQ